MLIIAGVCFIFYIHHQVFTVRALVAWLSNLYRATAVRWSNESILCRIYFYSFLERAKVDHCILGKYTFKGLGSRAMNLAPLELDDLSVEVGLDEDVKKALT